MMGADGGLREAVRRAARRARSDALGTVVLAASAVAPLVLLAAWMIGGRWSPGAVGPLLLVGGAVAMALGLAILLARRWVAPVTESAVAAAAERGRGLPEGSLRAVIELGRALPPGVSAALFRRSEREMASRLEGASAAELAGDLGDRVRTRRTALLAVVAGLALLTTAAGFAAPERARAGWAPLLHPVSYLRGPVLPPLTVRPGDAAVARGATLEIAIGAPLRSHVTIEWQAAGDVPRSRRLTVDGGYASGEIGPVDAEITYRVRAADGAVSPSFRARPVDPLLLAGLGLELVYPPHTGRSAERLTGEPPPIVVPEGTVLRASGRATRGLRAATFRRPDGDERSASVSGETFALDWRLDRAATGRWDLVIRDEAGGDAVAMTLDLTVRPDMAPRVRIVAPAVDTVMPSSRRQPVVADASDDYGVVAAALVYRRLGVRGERGPDVRAAVPLEPGAERALLRAVLDASAVPLGPGDAVEYYIEVRDNSPAGQVGVSDTYLLRVPSRASLRDEARRETAALLRDVEAAVDRARELDRGTREINRRSGPRSQVGIPGSGGSGSAPMDHERASEVRGLAAAHEDARTEIQELRDRLDRLRDMLAEAGLRTPDLERRLEELRDLYRQLAAPEQGDQVEALRRAADALDADAAAAALARLSEAQEELRRRLDASLGLLERAALEQEIHALAREAEEIAARQDVLSSAVRHEVGQPDGQATDGAHDAASRRADQQDQIAEQTARLTDQLHALQQRLLQQDDPAPAGQAAAAQEAGESAGRSMQEAAEQTRAGKGEEAAGSGEDAARSMTAAARALDEARADLGQAGKRQVQEAVQQATREALSLAEREDALRQQMEAARGGGGPPGAQGGELQRMQSEQAAVRQGLQQLGRNLSDADRQTGMVDGEVGRALARAMLAMDRAVDGLSAGERMPVREAERAVEALNRLAISLLETDARMSTSGSEPVDEALRRLAELAGEQGALNLQGAALAPIEAAAPAEAEQVQQLAESQQGIARRIGDVSGLLGGREDLLGRLDLMSGEAAAIARELDGGRLDPETRARQERLFHRLMDAGRSLEREEYTDERAGVVAGAVDRTAPSELDPSLLDAMLRYASPSAEQLRALPPAYRRLILDYFDRLNRGDAQRPRRAGDGEP